MISESFNGLFLDVLSWLITYSVHSTIISVIVLSALRLIPEQSSRLRERLLWIALTGGLMSASMATMFPPVSTSLTITLRADPPSLVAASEAEPGDRLAGDFPTETIQPATGIILPDPASGFDWESVLVQVWLILASGLILGLAVRWIAFQRSLEKEPLPPDSEPVRRFAALRGDFLPHGKVRLRISSRITCPMTTGMNEICLPEDFVRLYTGDEQTGVLAHELSHLERKDPLRRLLAELTCILFFFQPLNRILRERLRVESEYLADELALERTNNPAALARSLVKLAATISSPELLGLVPAMALDGASLTKRTMRMLNWTRERSRRRPSRAITLLILGTMLLVGWVLPRADVDSFDEPDPVDPAEISARPSTALSRVAPDTVITGEIEWLDGKTYPVRIHVERNTESNLIHPEGRIPSVDDQWITFRFEWPNESPVGAELSVVFSNLLDVYTRSRSADKVLENDEFRKVVEQVFELTGAQGIDYVVGLRENMDDYVMITLGRKPRDSTRGDLR